MIKEIKEAFQKIKDKRENKKRMDDYMSAINKYKKFMNNKPGPYGIKKHGDIVHSIEVDGLEIKSKDFILLKEEK